MSDQHDIYDQLFTFIQNLLARSGIQFNTREIAEKFGVSERTAQHCLTEIARSKRFPLWEEEAKWVFGLKPSMRLLISRDSRTTRIERTNIIKIFYCYARKDKALRDKIAAHLSPLRRRGQITEWSDHDILAGTDWLQAINEHLHTASIILLLLSSNFLQSDDCYDEMMRALERQREGKAHVIPIILSPVDWKETPIRHLQVLPRGGIPITQWRNREEAFQDIVKDVAIVAQALLTQLREQKTSEEWLLEGNLYSSIEKYEEALIAYDHALACDPTNASVHNNKSWIYNQLEQYEEALAASEQTILLDPTLSQAYTNKSLALQGLGRLEEAKQVIKLLQARKS